MSSRPFLKPFTIFSATSTGTSLTQSPPTIINQLPLVSFSMSWTGTTTGTFSVEASDDYSINPDGTVKNAGTWNSLPFSTTVAAVGSQGHGMYDVFGCGAYALRLVFTRSAGTGSLTAIVTGKVL